VRSGAGGAREGRPCLVRDISGANITFLHLPRCPPCLWEYERAKELGGLPTPNSGGCPKEIQFSVVDKDNALMMASSGHDDIILEKDDGIYEK